jgi:hypothetical protein
MHLSSKYLIASNKMKDASVSRIQHGIRLPNSRVTHSMAAEQESNGKRK